MFALLNPRLWLALGLAAALAFSHFTAYRSGKANVRNEWKASVAAANSEARQLEQARQRRADEAAGLAAAREAGMRADRARLAGERDGLRGDLDAVRLNAAQSLDAATRSVAALSAVFESCTRRYSDVAEAAARHASDSLTLQQAWPE